MNKSLTRGVFLGAAFVCIYALGVLFFSGTSEPGLLVLAGLGGALFGTAVGFVNAASILGIAQVIRVPHDMERVVAAGITGAITLAILIVLASDSTWPFWAHLLPSGVAALVGSLALQALHRSATQSDPTPEEGNVG